MIQKRLSGSRDFSFGLNRSGLRRTVLHQLHKFRIRLHHDAHHSAQTDLEILLESGGRFLGYIVEIKNVQAFGSFEDGSIGTHFGVELQGNSGLAGLNIRGHGDGAALFGRGSGERQIHNGFTGGKFGGQIKGFRFVIQLQTGFKHAQGRKIHCERFTGAGGNPADGLLILRQNDFSAGASVIRVLRGGQRGQILVSSGLKLSVCFIDLVGSVGEAELAQQSPASLVVMFQGVFMV